MKTYLVPLGFAATSVALRLHMQKQQSSSLKTQSASNSQSKDGDLNSVVSTVVNLLQDMVTETSTDAQNDAITMQKTKVWCAESIATLEKEIEFATENKNRGESEKFSASGSVSAAQSAIQAHSKAGAAAQKELNGASEKRDEEKTVYAKDEEALQGTLSELERATQILTTALKQNSMLSTSTKNSLMQMVNSLGTVTKSIGIQFEDHAKLEALVQSATEEEDDDDFDIAPAQATQVAYESKSGRIVDLLKSLTGDAEEQMTKLRQAEVTARHNYEMLAQTLTQRVKQEGVNVENEKRKLAQAQTDLGDAQKDIASAEHELGEKVPAQKQKKGLCAEVEPTYNKNQAQRDATLAALKSAIGILSDNEFHGDLATHQDAYPSFLQQKISSSSSSNPETRMKAAQLLEEAAHRLGSVGLEQVASKVSSGGNFDKVNGMISDMIERLTKQSTEEMDHQAFCEKEMGKVDAKLDLKTRKVQVYTSRQEKLDARIKQNELDMQSKQSLQAQSQKELAELQAEHAESQRNFNEFSESTGNSLSALSLAIERVSSILPTESSFVQLQEEPKAGGLATAGMPVQFQPTANMNSGPVEVLMTVQQQVEEEKAKRNAENVQAKNDFTAMDTSLKVDISSAKSAIEGLIANTASSKKSLADVVSDLTSTEEELAAAKTSKEELSKMCTYEGQSFAERNAARQEEIASLKQALEVLESETSR